MAGSISWTSGHGGASNQKCVTPPGPAATTREPAGLPTGRRTCPAQHHLLSLDAELHAPLSVSMECRRIGLQLRADVRITAMPKLQQHVAAAARSHREVMPPLGTRAALGRVRRVTRPSSLRPPCPRHRTSGTYAARNTSVALRTRSTVPRRFRQAMLEWNRRRAIRVDAELDPDRPFRTSLATRITVAASSHNCVQGTLESQRAGCPGRNQS